MNVLVVGGGAAGMMAAYAAVAGGHAVTLLEQNEKLGKKLFITGKGRCNFTNACTVEQLLSNVMSNRKFLYSAFYAFDNMQMAAFLERYGTPVKTERGGRMFPASDHSSDVLAALERALREKRVDIRLHTRVRRVLSEESGRRRVCGVQLSDGTRLLAPAVVLATGGISYPSTGATGDGYAFAKESGHRLSPRTPALVPMEVKEPWVKELQGLSLRNVKVTLGEGKGRYEEFGEMLFTHFGVSGPLILSASSVLPASAFRGELPLRIDLKPALTAEQLDKRLLREFSEQKNRRFQNALSGLLPSKLVPVVVRLSGIAEDTQVNAVSREDRQRLLALLKAFPLTVTGLRGFDEAIVTRGGVSVRDVNPSTMESKLMDGLYFCGELLDLDALTGGYNLQIAWSTGHLAGSNIFDR